MIAPKKISSSWKTSQSRPLVTIREKQILELVSFGYSTKEIASKLFLSKATIETHRGNLMNKLDCKNMAGLVRKGFECGILELYKLKS